MIKTQVQIPDELFARAKQVAAAKEWSFAEVVRRGLEYMTTVNPAAGSRGAWTPPEPHRLGAFRLPPEQWAEAARGE